MTPEDTERAGTQSYEDQGTVQDKEPSLTPETVARIGASLRLYYDHILSEPVPENLICLVDRYAEKGSDDDGG